MRATLARLGIDLSTELMIVFIPSSLEMILKGLKALIARNPFKNVRSLLVNASSSQLMIEDTTSTKSKIFHESFRYACYPMIKQ